MKTIVRAVALITALLVSPCFAAEVAGVQIPQTATVQNAPLVLNGAGLRSRFFVTVYVGALYLKQREATAAAVLAASTPKSMRMHIIYNNISGEDLADALNDGFGGNHTDAELAKLKPRIDLFRTLFPPVKRGDVVRLDLLTDGNTEVWVNDNRRGVIPGSDFQNGLLKIWLGDKPADKGLKQALLGGS